MTINVHTANKMLMTCQNVGKIKLALFDSLNQPSGNWTKNDIII